VFVALGEGAVPPGGRGLARQAFGLLCLLLKYICVIFKTLIEGGFKFVNHVNFIIF